MLSPNDPPAVPPRTWAVFLVVTAAFAALLVAHNRQVFAHPVYEDADYAANSLLVLKAKRLELLHGHYSRMNFYHPGPGLLYVLAAAEWVFYDRLHLVPAPHNAHMLGHLLLDAALLGVAVAVVTSATGRRRLGAAAGLVFLVFFAREGHLAGHWFAYTFFLVYLPFQFAAAAVASGRAGHLGWLALTGGLAVHSHICFVAFVGPVGLYAVGRLWAGGGYKFAGLPTEERRAWAVAAGVAALFALPIVLHVALHYPGEIGRYAARMRGPRAAAGTAGEAATFFVRTLTNDSPLGWPLAVGVGAAALAAVATFPARGRRFARQLGVVAVLSTAAMAYYVVRGVDNYQQVYIGTFFGSVLLLGWVLVGMRLAAAIGRGPARRGVAAVVTASVAGWAALTGHFTNPYAGSPGVPDLADAVCDDPRWASGPPALTLHHESWGSAAALLIELERRGKRAWVPESLWHIVFTDRFRLDGRPVGTLWQIDVAQETEPPVGVRRTFGAFGGVSFRDVDTRCALGTPIPLGRGGRPATGWRWGADHLLAVSGRAAVLVDVGPVAAPEVRLTIRACAVAQPRSLDGQRVGVAVNGEPVGDLVFQFDRCEEQSVVFPAAMLTRHTPVRIEFILPDAVNYESRRTAPLPRELYSIELRGLTLAPAGP